VVAANFVLVSITVAAFFLSSPGHDWRIYEEAGRRVLSGGLYEWSGSYAWSYSPLLAFAFLAVTPIGYTVWSLLHLAAIATIGRPLAIVAFVSWPFWVDLYNGNTLVFVFVAALAALRGSQIGTGAYLVLCLLMPRPIMLPVLAIILWDQPLWRIRFLFLAIGSAALLLVTGYAETWLATLLRVGDAVAVSSRDIGPAVLIGGWWVAIGGALAIVLTIFRRPGWASLAASPYWLPQYLLMLLLEVGKAERRPTVPPPDAN
jgi:hypothetical protein